MAIPGKKADYSGPAAKPHRHRFEYEVALRVAACDALRAWVRADALNLSPIERAELLTRARLLTGRATEKGLLD